MTSRRKKNVDKSSDFESFMRQTADYLPPAIASDKQGNKHDYQQESKLNNKELTTQEDKQNSSQVNKQIDKDNNKQISNELNAQANKDNDKQSNKELNEQTNKQDSKQSTSLSALFSETKPKEKIVNTTLQLPQSVNKRLKKLCQKLGKSKNEVLLTLIEALLEEKGL